MNNNALRTIGNLAFNDVDPGSGGAWFITNSSLTLQVSNGTPTISISNVIATIKANSMVRKVWSARATARWCSARANLYGGATTITSGALRAANNNALGSAASGTTIGNDPTARLELLGGLTIAEPLTVSCKGSANGNVPAVVSISGTNTLSGNVILTTGGSYWTFESDAGKLVISGTLTNVASVNTRTIRLRGAGSGEIQGGIANSYTNGSITAIVKEESGSWTLSGTNSYTGSTSVNGGTLLVNGSAWQQRVGGEQRWHVGGHGGDQRSCHCRLGRGSGARRFDRHADHQQSANALHRQHCLGGNQRANLNDDRVSGLSNVAYAGTLSVSNVAGTLLGGQSFELFSAAAFSGNFASILPATPGTGLAWGFNPTNGTLSVLSLGAPQISGFELGAGGSFSLSGTGPSGQGYQILTTTNLALPLSQWVAVSTGVFTNGAFSFIDTQATNYSRRYYRVATP